jgi:hypothetical protein
MNLDTNQITIKNRLNYWDCNRVWLYPLSPAIRLCIVVVACLFIGVVPDMIAEHKFSLFTAIYWFNSGIILNFFTPYVLMKGKGANINASLTFAPEAIVATLDDSSQLAIDWHNVSFIKREKDGIAVQIMRAPKAVLWLPEKRFASTQQADQFFTIIDKFWSTWLLEKSAEQPPATIVKTSDLSVEGKITLRERLVSHYYMMRYYTAFTMLLISTGLFSHMHTSIVIAIVLFFLPAYHAFKESRSQFADVLAVAVNEEGVHLLDGSSGYSGIIKWSLFNQIYVFQDLLIMQKNLSQAVVVPLRCFDSREKADAFVTATKKYIDADKMSIMPRRPD